MDVYDLIMEKPFASSAEKEDMDYMKVSTQHPSPTYQRLHINEVSNDAIYDKISACERTEDTEYELEQTTSDGIYENTFIKAEITGGELNPKTDASTQQLQAKLSNSDAVYDETTRFGVTTGEYDMEQMTSDGIYDNVLTKLERKGVDYTFDPVTNMQHKAANPSLNEEAYDTSLYQNKRQCVMI